MTIVGELASGFPSRGALIRPTELLVSRATLKQAVTRGAGDGGE